MGKNNLEMNQSVVWPHQVYRLVVQIGLEGCFGEIFSLIWKISLVERSVCNLQCDHGLKPWSHCRFSWSHCRFSKQIRKSGPQIHQIWSGNLQCDHIRLAGRLICKSICWNRLISDMLEMSLVCWSDFCMWPWGWAKGVIFQACSTQSVHESCIYITWNQSFSIVSEWFLNILSNQAC